MLKGKRKKPPSRVKYEQKHPTVSWRISKELYDRLQAVKEAEGKSTTDVLKVGVGLLEVKVSEEKEAREEGYHEGYGKGYEDAVALYKVTFPCSICRKTIGVTDKTTKEAIRSYMMQREWGHAECINRRR